MCTTDTLVDVTNEDQSLDTESVTSPMDGLSLLSPDERLTSHAGTLELPVEGISLCSSN